MIGGRYGSASDGLEDCGRRWHRPDGERPANRSSILAGLGAHARGAKAHGARTKVAWSPSSPLSAGHRQPLTRPPQVSARIHTVDVIGGILFAAAVTLLIALGLCDLFKAALPGPLMRLHEHRLLGLMIAALLIMAAIVLRVEGPMSPPDPNRNNG